MREKVKNDYGGDVRCIVDAARGSLVFSTLGGLLEVVEALVSGSSSADAAAAAGATQFIIVRVKDRLSKPATGGYRDIMLNGSVGGHVCELQLHIKNLVVFKAQAHVIYGILRSVGWDGDERPIALRPEPAASAAAPSSKAAASDASGGAAVVEEPKASEPNYSGLLHKRGHVRTNWKQRYFEIQGSEVLYYVRKRDDAPKGRIPLRGATVIGWRTGSVAGHDSEFAVVTHSGEQYPLRAHTPVARKKWELELEKAIGQAT